LRPKDQGTRLETWLKLEAQDWGLMAERLAEGGRYDLGDVEILTNQRWIIECKDRQQLNIHEALTTARLKAPDSQVAVLWKRMKRKPGNQRRFQVGGEPIVAMTVPAFLALLQADCRCA